MKEYNIKLLVDNDRVTFIYDCDKEKNRQCNKRNCNNYCNHTTDSRYMKAKARQRNKNITDEEIIIELEKEIEQYREKIQHIYKNKILISKPKDTITYETTDIYTDERIAQTIINYEY